MTSDRKIARVAGALFIVATVASIASVPFLGSVNSSSYLVDMSANANQVMIGTLLVLIAALTSASIAISLYPILRKYSEGLALGAVGFRLIEGALYTVGLVNLLSLLALSQEFVKAGSPNSSSFQPLGVSLLAGYHWAYYVAGPVAFALGALMYYYIFYLTKLVPRWISAWGLAGATLLIIAAMLVMFGVIGLLSTYQAVMVLPIAVQEMVLAVWLIAKGFNLSPAATVK